MKIALVAHLKYPIGEPFFGGLEMHTHLLASKLSARGHDVTLFASTGSPGAVSEVAPTASLGAKSAAVEHSAYDAIMTRVADGAFDIVHCNALHYLPLQRAASLSMPMVAVLHTPPFDPLEAAVLSSVPGVIFVAVSGALASQWPSSVGALVIDNGIDLGRFRFGASVTDDRFAFWSGRIVPEKGLHLAIDAARIAGLPLRIAGPMIDLEYWDTEIAPRLDDAVNYLGHLEHAEIAAMLCRASVVVCTPRWEEPFGLVLAEALACGTPVAGFARGALPSILDASCGALAPADDVSALAVAVRACLALDRAACRARAETLFDADLMIARYEALYHKIVTAHVRTSKGRELVDGAGRV